jgi:nucleolar protein 12
VDELLALPPEKLKLSSRKLRLERCQSSSSAKAKSAKKEQAANKSKGANDAKQKKQQPGSSDKPAPTPADTAKFAEELSKLSKEQRKAIKSSDENRLARRLAKKESKKKSKAKDEIDTIKAKDFVLRHRRNSSLSGKKKTEKKKGRVRSDNAEMRKNQKKH